MSKILRIVVMGSLVLVLALALVLGGPAIAVAADPAFVGVLSLVVEPDVAKELGLSDDVKGQLVALIDKRELEVQPLALNKELPAEERATKLAEFVAESEKQGLALLTDEQKTKLGHLRIAKLGMIGLGDAKVATDLGITRVQQLEIEKLIKEYNDIMASGSEFQRKLARSSAEKRLAALLTEEQRGAWEKLTGSKAGLVAQTAPAPAGDAGASAPPSNGTGGRSGSRSGDSGRSGPSRSTAATQKGIPAEKGPNGEVLLRFNFTFAPWKDVLEWFAEQSNLSFTTEQWPQGTFNYSTSQKYTQQQAMDVINRVLLVKGWVLVINERMMMLFNVADGPVPEFWVPLVAKEDLEKKGRCEFVKVVYSVSKLTPEAADAEARKLIDPARGNVILFSLAKQIIVTETVEKQLLIRGMVSAIEESKDERMDIIKLTNLLPIEFMAFARPLLQIPDGTNATPDGSLKIVADDLGGRLIVSGKANMVERVHDLVTKLDPPDGPGFTPGAPEEKPQLIIYTVKLADPATVLQVLQTLLTGNPDVRLTHDANTGSIIAMAKPAQHATIRATIDELEGKGGAVEVFKLRKADPAQMVLSINKLFGETSSGGRDRNREQSAGNGPRVDADPINMMLYVKGTPSQIEAVRQFLIKIGESGLGADDKTLLAGDRKKVRMLPLASRDAPGVLEQVEALMGGRTRIRYVMPSNSRGPAIPQGNFRPQSREVSEAEALLKDLTTLNSGATQHPQGAGSNPTVPAPAPGQTTTPKAQPAPHAPAPTKDTKAQSNRPSSVPLLYVAYQAPAEGTPPAAETKPAAPQERRPPEPAAPAAEAPSAAPTKEAAPAEATQPQPESEIVVVATPNGIMIRSDDLEALDQYEEFVKGLTPSTGGKRYTVYYLKYAKAEIASSLLTEMLTGAPADSGGGGGNLMGDLAQQMIGDIGGGLLGNFLGGSGGAGGTAIATGAASITPDPRLNALIVSATPRDLDIIEQLLQVIDQPQGPDGQQIVAAPRFIPVNNNRAEDVAAIVKQAYSGRILGEGGGGGARGNPQEEFLRAMLSGRGRGGSSSRQQNRGEEAKMTVAVDNKSNSLIVSAPDYLFNEVKQLVEQLDVVAVDPEQTVRVVALKRASANVMQQQLTSRLGPNATIKAAGTTTSTSTSTRTPTTPGTSSQPGSTGNQQPQFNPEDVQRRMEFFNALRGGDSGRGGGFGGGAPGAFGGFGGGGPGSFGSRGGLGGGDRGGGGFGGFGGGDRGGGNFGGFGGGDRGGGNFGGGDRGGGGFGGGDRGGGDRGGRGR